MLLDVGRRERGPNSNVTIEHPFSPTTAWILRPTCRSDSWIVSLNAVACCGSSVADEPMFPYVVFYPVAHHPQLFPSP